MPNRWIAHHKIHKHLFFIIFYRFCTEAKSYLEDTESAQLISTVSGSDRILISGFDAIQSQVVRGGESSK
jgi:hypothetical protein